MRKILFFIVFLINVSGFSQSIKGTVANSKNELLTGANICWINTNSCTTTNAKGEFNITDKDVNIKKIVASFIGYMADTIEIANTNSIIEFKLKEINTLSEVIVKGQRDGVIISDINSIKTEKITQTELQKSACCDLAGCFETQTTVQPQVTNVITNSKELRILGLSGVYNQVLVDGLPMIQGLSYTYGISGIPGTLVDNIYVAKGANSVLQGFESISGQINVETKEPDKTDKLLLNIYMNSFFEKHLNLNYAFKKEKWSNLTAIHSIQAANKTDKDKDNFLDLPLLTRYMIFNKWKYGNESENGLSSMVGMRFLNERRIGGQKSYNPDNQKGSTVTYGQIVNINQPDIWSKTAYKFTDNHKVALYASAFHQNQQSFFGTVKYNAKQTNFYSNLQYELNYSDNNSFKTGISYRRLYLNENIAFTDTLLKRNYAGEYIKSENILGIFAENSINLLDNKITWITGIRADNHNKFGTKITPRTLIKYDVIPQTIIRGSIGTGWRTVNLFSENIGLLVSSRNIIFAEELKPEKALNFGLNLTHKFENDVVSGYFSADYYRTNFQNQIFPDYDSNPTQAIIKNFTGTSVSNGFQAELLLKIGKRFELKNGYNYLDVYRKINQEKILLPFNSEHKLLTTFSYKPLSEKFHFDVNIHWFGRQRLPDTKSNPAEFQQPNFSKSYSTINAQFTYSFTKIEVYTGCENIFNFRQNQPIVSWQNPFSPYFDTSYVWGPTRGRELYAGIRFKIPQN